MIKKYTIKCHCALKELLQKSGITEAEIAEMCNVQPLSVTKWRLNLTLPSVANIIKLSEYFQVSLSYFLGLTTVIAKNENYELNMNMEKLLQEAGMTAKQLAIKIETTESTVSSYISKPKYTQINTLLAMADVLDMSIDYLLGMTTYKNWNFYVADILNDPLYEIPSGSPFYLITEVDGVKVGRYGLLSNDRRTVYFSNGMSVEVNDATNLKTADIYKALSDKDISNKRTI